MGKFSLTEMKRELDANAGDDETMHGIVDFYREKFIKDVASGKYKSITRAIMIANRMESLINKYTIN